MAKKRSMRSFVDERGEPVKPPYCKLKVYLAAIRTHEGLQIARAEHNGLSREVKYADVMEVKREIREIMCMIGKADETRNRAKRASIQYEALNKIPDIFFSLRTLADLRFISETRWSVVTLELESTRSQMDRWYNYTLEEVKKQENGLPLSDDDIDLFYDIEFPPVGKDSKK